MLCLSAIRELKRCHAAGFIVTDLTADNIFYDRQTQRSYLIDGGDSYKKDEALPKFEEDKAILEYKRQQFYDHIAPEFFFGEGVAHEGMDVYSFGRVMIAMIELMEQRQYPITRSAYTQILIELMTSCMNKNPTQRPSLDELAYEIANYIESSEILEHLEALENQLKQRGMYTQVLVELITFCKDKDLTKYPYLLGNEIEKHSEYLATMKQLEALESEFKHRNMDTQVLVKWMAACRDKDPNLDQLRDEIKKHSEYLEKMKQLEAMENQRKQNMASTENPVCHRRGEKLGKFALSFFASDMVDDSPYIDAIKPAVKPML